MYYNLMYDSVYFRTRVKLLPCIKPFSQPRDAARQEGVLKSEIWMKKVYYFCVVVGGQKGFAREHQNGFYET